MSDIDRGPKSNPIPKEGTPKQKGLHFRIDNPDLIYKALQNGVEGELGSLLLEKPLRGVELMSVKSDADTFNLMASIDTRATSFMGPELNIYNVLEKFSKQCGLVKERGGKHIIRASSGRELLLDIGTMDDFIISTGTYIDYGHEYKQLFPAPELSEESFDASMKDVTETTQKLVDYLYRIHEQTTPDEEFVITPPKRSMETDSRTGMPKDLVGKVEIEKPNVSFEDIGGLKEAKREIQGLAFALKNPELYRKWGTKPPKGILLFGPPGTGKTLLAKAFASQADAGFFHVQASDIANKYYGESEKIIDTIFELAGRKDKKTIIFFDEIDAIAPHRTGAHEATQRVISTMLEKMDGLASNDNVMVISSTNRLEAVEPALLRAGRFDRWVEAPLPDEEGRKQIFTIHMNKAEKIAERELFSGVNLDVIVSKTEKLSGADIAEVIRRSLEEKVRQEGVGNGVNLVNTDDIFKELDSYEKVRETKKQMGFGTS